MFLTAQKLPHMEQVSSFSGLADSLYLLAFSGSIARSNISSQSSFFLAVLIFLSQSDAPGIPLAISAAWAAILAAIIPSFTSVSYTHLTLPTTPYV